MPPDPLMDSLARLTNTRSYLSIPSFKWYRAGSLTEGRMTHVCQPYGRQILGVGGRLAWAIDSKAGCYSEPVFLYDAVSEVDRTEFDVRLSHMHAHYDLS